MRRILACLLFIQASFHADLDAEEPCDAGERELLQSVHLLAAAPRPSDERQLRGIRDGVRRLRLTEPSLLLDVTAADLALVASDEEEATRIFTELARNSGELLSPWDRFDLARAAEARGDRRGAIFQYGHVLTSLQRRGETTPAWIGDRIRRLDVEDEARTVLVARFPAPSAAARQAFAEGRKLMSLGRESEAAECLRRALRLSPGYVEAALAIGSIEARAGKTPEAIAAYRTALAADPARFEAILSLANLLWVEPDRQAKEESLALLDRAISLRPEANRLRKEASERWASWGDAARALERLDAYRRESSEEERRATEAARQRLAQRVSHPESGGGVSSAPDLTSPALPSYKLAEVYALRRGDAASLDAALDLLAEAQRLDRGFAPAFELEATIRHRRGESGREEEALRRAITADPTRATLHERLAALLSREPGRKAEALAVWERAERAGSLEALFQIARGFEAAGEKSRAEVFYRRSLKESPDGPHADESRLWLASRAENRKRISRAGGIVLALGAAAFLALVIRRYSGTTLARWLESDPAQGRAIRPIIGRLRHETFKHGGLLLEDSAQRLRTGDDAVRKSTASLLLSRLFSGEDFPSANRGLVPESLRTLDELKRCASEQGVSLNLRHKDTLFSPVYAALFDLRRGRASLEKIAREPASLSSRAFRSLERRMRRATEILSPAQGQKIGALVDATSSTRADGKALDSLLRQVAHEAKSVPPKLELLGALAESERVPIQVRVDHGDWETIWRNLFSNAIAAGSETGASFIPELALRADKERDPITGEALVRFVLGDDIPRPLTTEMIRGRAAERGLGIVADLVRRNEGMVDVGPPPIGAERLRKGIVIQLPAVEEEPCR